MFILRKMVMILAVVFGIAYPIAHTCGANPIENKTTLDEGFQHPPKSARPSTYYLLLNGYMNRTYMEQELAQLHKMGIRGLCVFDMGGRGRKENLPPSGPAFMSEKWRENFALLVQKAGVLDMDVQLAVSSSWDMGASWVKPEQASKALYHSSLNVTGPTTLNEALPFPDIPKGSPRDSQGRPLYYQEVTVLAIPENERQSAHEFILQLPHPDQIQIDHVVLYNCRSDDSKKYGTLHLFSKDFSIAVSQTDTSDGSFREILRDSLKPNAKPQRFDFPATHAKYIRLHIYNGYNPRFDQIQLGEFEVYSTKGRNVAGSHEADRTQSGAKLIRFSSQAGHSGRWTADNIHDGVLSGPNGSWSSAGPPPLIIKNPAAIINLTDRLDSEGNLKWEVPSGTWTLLRFICANTGERLKVPSPASNGLATDHFSSRATEDYLRHLTDLLHQKLGDFRTTSLKQLYLPSYEVRGAIWTTDFIGKFKKYRNYDPTRYLPALLGYVIENQEVTDRFVYDFRKTLGDLLVDAYYRTASTSAHRVGLGVEAESGGPGPPVHQVPVDALKALGAIDEMRGEFWPWRQQSDALWVVKETACAAHVYGRRRVHMEAFTGFYHWESGPFELKPAADRAFCEGMNHVVWHTCSHQSPEAGKPGWVYGAGTHLTPNLIWWPKAKSFIDYLSRCSYMLQQGWFVADVCYYYGDQGSNFVPPKHIDPSLGYGYDYDVANPEVILNRLSVRNDRITLPDGMQYELLVLPDRDDIDLQVLRKLADLVKAGATIVGPKPTRSDGLHDYRSRDQQVKQLADSLWGNCDGKTVFENSLGKGKVIWRRSLRDILLKRKIGPDFQYDNREDGAEIDFIHRRTSKADIYFVSNKKQRAETIDAQFRVTGKAPELWDPDTGRIRNLPIYQTTSRGIRVTLHLPPAGSIFVVFRKTADRPHLITSDAGITVNSVTEKHIRIDAFQNGRHPMKTSDGRTIEIAITQIPSAQELTGPWKVYFPTSSGVPESVPFTTLKSWTEHDNTHIRYFSGIARYEKEVTIPADWLGMNRKLYLDLGRLWAVGDIRLNGQSLGIVWKPPYRVDITHVAQAGANRLEIDIANTWANRLIGDAHLPQDQRYCRTNITGSGTPRRAWKDILLHESGLLGPVTLVPAVVKTITITE